MNDSTTPMKTCKKCGQDFPATAEYFSRNKRQKDGLFYYCKTCKGKSDADYYLRNKASHNKKARQYYIDNRDAVLAMTRRYKEANKAWYSEYMRQYRLDNYESISKYQRAWESRNRDRLNAMSRRNHHKYKVQKSEYGRRYRSKPENLRRIMVNASRRRARKLSLPDTFTVEQWECCLEYFNYTCPVCDSQLRDLFGDVEPHADHWIPLSYEGDDNLGTVAGNMICLCNSCNLSKSAKLPADWLAQNYSKRKASHILERVETYFNSLE